MEGRIWLVTGGMGFIGTNLVRAINSNHPNDLIYVIDNLQAKSNCYINGISDNIVFKNIDVLYSGFELFLEKCDPDIIVHLASETNVRKSINNPKYILERNINGLLTCLDFSLKNAIHKFIFASSAGCVGRNAIPLDENSFVRPESPYSTSKAIGELMCSSYAKLGLNVVSLRFSNVYGPYSLHKENLIIKIIKNILEGEPITINGDGFQTRDFIYVDAVTDAIIKVALDGKIKNGTFCISTCTEYSINETIHLILKEMGFNGTWPIIHKPPIQGEVMNVKVENKKARKAFNFNSGIDLKSGIKKTINWVNDREGDQ